MKRIFYVLLLLMFATEAGAQTGVIMNRYYITGSLSLGQPDKTFADTTAWLQLGKDTTKKGLLLPRVILDSITTTKKGLFVYDLKDSVLYHFDGTKRVRYMTYKDTGFIKQIITGIIPVYTAGYGLVVSGYQFKTDTTLVSSKAFVNNENARNMKIADTAAMLLPYLRKIDTTNKWFVRAWTTDYLAEGSTNKYYTDARARAALSITGSGLSYNSTTGVLSNTATLDNVLTNGSSSTQSATIGKATVNGSLNAASSNAIATLISPTLIASANGDTLTALKISPTYSTGSFSGVYKLGIASLSSTALNYIVGNTAFGGFNGAPDAAISLANNKMLGWQITGGGTNTGFGMTYTNTDDFTWMKQGVNYFDLSFSGAVWSMRNLTEVNVDRSGGGARFAIIADDNQQAYINFRQSANHLSNRWDLSSAATTHDFSLYNYTTATPSFTVTAATNALAITGQTNFASGIKLGGYTGAYQVSAVLGMPNNTMIGWAGAGSPGGNLHTKFIFDASNILHLDYGGSDIYTYTSRHNFYYGGLYVDGNPFAHLQMNAIAGGYTKIRWQESGSSQEVFMYKAPGSANLFIRKNVSGLESTMLDIDAAGNGIFGGYIKTVQPTGNGAGVIKIGKIRTGSDSNKYWEVDVDGTVYYLLALTTLP